MKMERNIKIGEFTSDQERRQALVDCTDIMFNAMSEATSNQALIDRFVLAKTLHNKILSQMAENQ